MRIREYSDKKISAMRIAAQKHIYSIVKYLTIRKIYNIALAVTEMYASISRITAITPVYQGRKLEIGYD